MTTEIFVFGSNRAGIHGAGAAAYAYKTLNAKWGVGEGLTGSCYALPTKNRKIESYTRQTLAKHIRRFIQFADKRPNLTFRVTRVGCGLAGFTDIQVAPMFLDAPANCLFDTKWKPYLFPWARFWGTYEDY